MVDITILNNKQEKIELSNGIIHIEMNKEETYFLIHSLLRQLESENADKDKAYDLDNNSFCISVLHEEE